MDCEHNQFLNLGEGGVRWKGVDAGLLCNEENTYINLLAGYIFDDIWMNCIDIIMRPKT